MRNFVCSCAVVGSEGCGKKTLIKKFNSLITEPLCLPIF